MAGNLESMLVELEEEEAVYEVRRRLAEGEAPLLLVEELRSGMSTVGKRFEDREYFLSELIMSAEIFKQAMELVENRMPGGAGEPKGSVVIGTVQGDIHDIGKNIVVSLLRCDGFEVHDLGVDVAPLAFVEKLRETGVGLLAMSGLLTLAFDSMKKTVDCITTAGLRDRVKVIVGGGPVNEAVAEYAGADACGKDAAEAVKLVKSYVSQVSEPSPWCEQPG